MGVIACFMVGSVIGLPLGIMFHVGVVWLSDWLKDRAPVIRRWIHRFRRQHGPTIRLWDKDFKFLHTEPVSVESWSDWRSRQLRRVIP